ncbi:TetR family transcriptional regulator C-terminal domain-containing protein [Kumtagia ephedrae]|jgi:AcrR family transcriptional regulator|uniref:TetR family transcriptional regulator n=1 Tax=Kumtagia ephedrae TaxID=2116701 RepID=A0A2P7RVQ3_9HYPH|nr:TetR family transcriptional regulator C-terminal domain-containing protein [Mesorhizobium ephedrae]PSJ54304.1 TetR family transcriptional regulator [Mesorhizobium ephedrae]
MGRTALKQKAKGRNGAALTREDQVAERRQSLLDAAVAVIAREGLVGITIRSIAAEAGCSYGVVSFHFNSKEGIILAALDYTVEEYEQALKLDAGTPAARLKTMIESDFGGKVASARRLAFWLAFWAESVRVPSYRKRCAELKARYNAYAEADVAALAEARGVKVDAGQVARSLNAMIDGFWIANLVMDNAGPAGQAAAKQACFAFLRAIFPEDF